MDALAPIVDSIESIGTINAPGAAPFYPEPCIFFFDKDGNNTRLVAAGWKSSTHESFQNWFPTVMSSFTRVGVELALNTYPEINDDGDVIAENTSLYKTMAAALISTVSNRSVLANYSMRSSFTTGSGNYQQMYDWMKTQYAAGKVWYGVQLARPQNLAQTLIRR